MNGRIYDPLLGRFLSADLLLPNPGNLQDYNRYSYVRNNPLGHTDPSGFDPLNIIEGNRMMQKARRNSPPPDKFEGKGNWRQLYNYINKILGGTARVFTVDERRKSGPEIIDPHAPKLGLVDTVRLQGTPGQAMLTKAMGVNLGVLSGASPSRSSPMVSEKDMKEASTEVKQKTTEVSQRTTRGRNGGTRMVGQRSTPYTQTRGQIQFRDTGMQANGKAMGGLVGLAASAIEGTKQAAEMTEVQVNLVYSGGFLFGLFSRPTGEIVVQQAADMNRVQGFAEHHDLPSLNITDRTVKVSEDN